MKSIQSRQTAHSLTFVGLSFLFSALLHIAALIWLSHVGFELLRHSRNLEPEQRHSFSLSDIRKIVTPALSPTKGEGLGKGGASGDGDKGYARTINPDLTNPGNDADGSLVGADSAILKHTQAGEADKWQPRQDVVAISGKLLGEDLVKGNRRLIPDIERMPNAPDVVFPVAYDKLKRETGTLVLGGAESDDISPEVPVPLLPKQVGATKVDIPSNDISGPTDMIDGSERKERKVQALDDVLDAKLTVYSPFLDSKNKYFKLEVKRISDKLLPELPKDILFVQDSSASMAEQRLHFCREGLAGGLEFVKKEDRFNIIAFSDAPVACFDGWASPGKSTMERAGRFVANLRSAGSTDILGSLSALRDIKTEKGRPCIAFLITDGLATTGIVESAEIIREFTKDNSEGISVFTMGTMSEANMYLLDLLSYCNGGSTHVVKGGRWSIAEDITNQIHSISRPVLSNLQLAFAGRDIEVFPAKVRHLYMDEPLVLYGKCPKSMKRVTFQAIGSAGENRCDMIFDLPLDRSNDDGSKSIKQDWAMQKVYHLMGEMARKDDDRYREELKTLAKDYDLKLPYAYER